MEIISDLRRRFDFKNPVITIGNFDGVHIGHQKIFKSVVENAKAIKGTPLAITFDPHPVRVIAPERGLKMITSFDDKVELMSRSGIAVILTIPFDREFAKTEPEGFIQQILVGKLGAKWVIVGHSYTFGKAKKGTTALLRRKGRKYGFKVSVIRYAKAYGEIVSSSRVRSLLLRGRVCEAGTLLGRPYHIQGEVIKGAGRGASLLHTPTANILTPNELIPREGVYAVKVSFVCDHHAKSARQMRKTYDGVANIGKNPTFHGEALSYEVHLFDFDGDLLGEKMRIHFIERIRDERKFSTVQELEEQIDGDKKKARYILSRRDDPLYL